MLRQTGSGSRLLRSIRRPHSLSATKHLKSVHAVTPHHAVLRNHSGRSAQSSSSRPVVPLRSRLSRATWVSSMNLGWEANEGSQTSLSELNRHSLQVRLFWPNSVRLTDFTCADSRASIHRIFSMFKGAAPIYRCSRWCLSPIYLVQEDVSILFRFFGWASTITDRKTRRVFPLPPTRHS